VRANGNDHRARRNSYNHLHGARHRRPQTDVRLYGAAFQAKAKADGEDIITPMVEQAAQMIVDQSAKK
jgi:hypothetical protein